jgi:hypothetical protein
MGDWDNGTRPWWCPAVVSQPFQARSVGLPGGSMVTMTQNRLWRRVQSALNSTRTTRPSANETIPQSELKSAWFECRNTSESRRCS